MSTIAKKFYEQGYCEVDKKDVTIEIKYISVPKIPGDEVQEFCKAENRCIYLREGKCSIGNECEIYKKAKTIKKINEMI